MFIYLHIWKEVRPHFPFIAVLFFLVISEYIFFDHLSDADYLILMSGNSLVIIKTV